MSKDVLEQFDEALEDKDISGGRRDMQKDLEKLTQLHQIPLPDRARLFRKSILFVSRKAFA